MEIEAIYDGDGVTGYTLAQDGYLEELLREYQVKDKAIIPMPKEWANVTENPDENYPEEDLKAAQSAVGALLWLSQRTRPDIAFVVGVMGSACTKQPSMVVRMARRVLAYLNETKTHRLHYFKSELPYSELVTYTDASQGEKSVGAAVVPFQGCAVAWRTGKQKMISTSSAEAELQASTEGAHMMISIEAVLIDMGIEVDGKRLLVDYTAAITLASQDNASWRTRHLKLRANWLRERVQEGDFEPQHCRGEDQLADVITKVVPSRRMEDIMKRWGMGAKDSDLRSVEIRATYVEDESTFSPHGVGYPEVNDIFGDTLDIMKLDELDLGAESCDGGKKEPQPATTPQSQPAPRAELQPSPSQQQATTPRSQSAPHAELQHRTRSPMTPRSWVGV